MAAGVSVYVDDKEAQRLLHLVLARGKALPLRRIGVIGVASTMRTFQAEGRPRRWPGLKAKYGPRVGGKPLQDQGDLKRSVNYRILGTSDVAIYTNDSRAAHHQYGAPKASIPQRRFLLWQAEDIRKIVAVLQDHITGGK